MNSDSPLSMDIDGNNTSDLTIFRPSNGTWYIRRMGDIIKPRHDTSQDGSNYKIIKWGIAGDKPLAGDFNADGRDELVIFRPSEGNWYVTRSSDNTFSAAHFGLNGDIPAMAYR